MNTPFFIEFTQGKNSYAINLDCVTDIKLEKNESYSSVGINYADRTYTHFEGSEHDMVSLYTKIINGISNMGKCYRCDLGGMKPNSTLPNLDQCVLITENDDSKEIRKL